MEHQINNLGQVAALIISIDPPNIKTVFWYDISAGEEYAVVKFWNGKDWISFEELDVSIIHNNVGYGGGELCKLPESNANSGSNIFFRKLRNNSSRIVVEEMVDSIILHWTDVTGVLVDSNYETILSSDNKVIATSFEL